ncbi:hypothetical protein B5P44_24800 [Mycobacterium sp. CBMA 213]|nr:hypothetical protein [Mycolicibacterium sp. CBMA 213]
MAVLRRLAQGDVRDGTWPDLPEHHVVGTIELAFDSLDVRSTGDDCLVLNGYTVEPGSPADEKLRMLASWIAPDSTVAERVSLESEIRDQSTPRRRLASGGGPSRSRRLRGTSLVGLRLRLLLGLTTAGARRPGIGGRSGFGRPAAGAYVGCRRRGLLQRDDPSLRDYRSCVRQCGGRYGRRRGWLDSRDRDRRLGGQRLGDGLLGEDDAVDDLAGAGAESLCDQLDAVDHGGDDIADVEGQQGGDNVLAGGDRRDREVVEPGDQTGPEPDERRGNGLY